MSDEKYPVRPCVECGEMVARYVAVPDHNVRCDPHRIAHRKAKKNQYQRTFRERQRKGELWVSSDLPERACVDCGEMVQRSRTVPDLKVRCDVHRDERRKKLRREAANKFYSNNKTKILQERKKKKKKAVSLVCEICGSEFERVPRSNRPLPTTCSRSCSSQKGVKERGDQTHVHPCVDCGVAVRAVVSLRPHEVRCDKHRDERKSMLYERSKKSRRTRNNVEQGEAPYEDYVVVGPSWVTKHEPYGWRVTVKHRAASNKREMSLAHYRLSVKEGRRLRDVEEIVFLDGDIDNCDPSNLELSSSKKREVA